MGGKRLRGDESEVRRRRRGGRSKKVSVKRGREASGKAARHPGEVRGKGLKRWKERRSVERTRGGNSGGNSSCWPPLPPRQVTEKIPPAYLAFRKHGLDQPCFLPVRDYPPFLVRMEGIKGRGEIKHGNVYIYLKIDCQRLREKEMGGEGE